MALILFPQIDKFALRLFELSMGRDRIGLLRFSRRCIYYLFTFFVDLGHVGSVEHVAEWVASQSMLFLTFPVNMHIR